MKKTARQNAIIAEMQWCERRRNKVQGESFLLRTPSKRQKRLIREYWAIARQGVSA